MAEVIENQEVTQSVEVQVPHGITVNADKTVDIADFSFRFKKDKMGNQRPKVELKLPVPSYEGIVAILEAGGKQLDLLRDAIYDVVRSVAADIVADNEKISQENFPVDKISWKAIAEMPKEDRRSSTIAKEVWEAFAADYLEVMPGVTNKSVEAIGNAVEVYLKKFSIVKGRKDVLGKLKEQLGLYMEHSKKAEEFQEILDLLFKRIETYMAADDVEALVANL